MYFTPSYLKQMTIAFQEKDIDPIRAGQTLSTCFRFFPSSSTSRRRRPMEKVEEETERKRKKIIQELTESSSSDMKQTILDAYNQDQSILIRYVNVFASHRIVSDLLSNEEDSEFAFEEQCHLFDSFVSIYSNDHNWIVPSMCRIVRNLIVLANRADISVSKKNGPRFRSEKYLLRCKEKVRTVFSKTISDRKGREQNRKIALVEIAHQLLRLNFKVNTLQQCFSVLKTMNPMLRSSQYPLEGFPKSHSVPYMYYLGRLRLSEGNYVEAEECLDFAYDRCHVDAKNNRRNILYYAIPVKMVRGVLPTLEALTNHGLTKEFGELIRTVRTGNIHAFDAILQRDQERWIAKGIYFLLVEWVRFIVLRNLLKRIWTIRTQKNARVRVLDVSRVLYPNEDDLSSKRDETECMLANLIYRQYVRGYIHHQCQVLVLSKKVPFPKLPRKRFDRWK